jgi:hypothetical protein
VSDRYDRAVTALVGAGVLTCAVAVAVVRPAPLPASDAARWAALAAHNGSDRHQYGRSWQIDDFATGAGEEQPYVGQVLPVRQGRSFTVWGWALDPRARRPAARLLERIDGGPWRPARYGVARPDLALRFDLGSADGAGYGAEVATAGLAPGRHELTLATADARGRILPMTPPVPFVVTPP